MLERFYALVRNRFPINKTEVTDYAWLPPLPPS